MKQPITGQLDFFTSDFTTTTTYNVVYPYTLNMTDYGFPQDGLLHTGMTADFSDFSCGEFKENIYGYAILWKNVTLLSRIMTVRSILSIGN